MRRSEAVGPGISLFPFLAVLLCTMGALIVVLVVINKQANRNMARGGADKTAARRSLELDIEELELQIVQLTGARAKTLEELDFARRRLSGLEDKSRELTDELDRLKQSAELLEAEQLLEDQANLRAKLAAQIELREKIEAEAAKARQAAESKPSYAIIPYDGRYRTNRRPIYIECRSDAVVLQPEGIRFTPDDFRGPPGPGNPLASALRAAREYWSAVPPAEPGTSTEPYPLLLVRPDGIIAYYLVRDAMSSWASEFGYELIDDDWKLEFPVRPDPRLVDMEKRAVAEARDRLRWLAEVSPEVFERRSTVQYRLSKAKGGLVRDGGPELGNDPFANDPLGGFGRTSKLATPAHSGIAGETGGDSRSEYIGHTVGRPDVGTLGLDEGGLQRDGSQANSVAVESAHGIGTGNGEMGIAANPTGNAIVAGDGRSGNPSSVANPYRQIRSSGDKLTFNRDASAVEGIGAGGFDSAVGPRYAAQGNSAVTGETYSAVNGGTAFAANDLRRGSPGMSDAYNSDRNSDSARGDSAVQAEADGSPDSLAGVTRRDDGASGGAFGSVGSESSFGQPGSTMPGSLGAQAGAAASSGSSTSAQPAGAMPPGMPSLNMQPHQPQPTSSEHPIADTRGRNWALPDREASSLPITRPIRIECMVDRLVLVPDVRDQQAQVIKLGSRTSESVDELLSAVRTHMRTWGIAGQGMYWKPQLILKVDPAADGRAADLQALLADSGLDVKRK